MSLTFRLRGIVLAFALSPLGASSTSAQATDPVTATRTALRKAKAHAAKQPRASMMPREAYLRRPDILDVRLSPDGRHLSFLRRGEKGVDLMLQNVSSGIQTRVVSGLQRAETAWSGDGRRLWLSDEQGLAVIESGSRVSAKRIVKWNLRTKQKFFAVDSRAAQYAIIHERVATSGTERHRYLRVDAEGRTRLLFEAALPLRSVLLNANGELAFTAAFEGSRYETVIRRHTTTSGPRQLLRCSSIEECRLIGYNQAQQTVWVLSQHGEDRLALQRWQQKSERWETVHRDPAVVADADALLWSDARQNWLAIAYHGGQRRWYGNGSETRTLLTALERQLPDANLQLSPTTDGRLWLVRAQQSDRALDRHYLYRPAPNRLQPLFAREDAAKKMPPGAAMHPVSYRARDGMLLHGYVLLPGGIAPAKAPLVAWLHGGPITRLYDRYDAVMQLLVNRGYAVFVPNFRASTGYGLKYVLAAKGDVGNGRVLADIIDGLDFLLAEGIGDRNRQAVMGMSFGGYASLLALSHHPSRFRFAFAGAPPTEYGWIKQWQADHDSEALRPEGPPLSLQFPQLGFPYRNAPWRLKMQRESPLAALPALTAPAYIWAGARDDRVPLKSIVHYAGEARRLGKPLSLLIDPNGGHVPQSTLGDEALLYLLENAAHRHFGGAVSPASPELKAFLQRNVRIDA